MAAKTTKGERTRARILETALDMFRERGYEHTTMRAIAGEAGVSLGNAYYYFKSKEHLIQAFYARTHDEHLVECAPLLAEERDFERRLQLAVRTKIDTSMPYQRFAGVLSRSAADPRSPLNPFSAESLPVRQEATELFAEVIAGSDIRVHEDLAAELPNLLWIYHMGILLFWIFDDSDGCRRTYRLAERATELVVRLVKGANLRPMRPLMRSTLGLLAELREDETARG